MGSTIEEKQQRQAALRHLLEAHPVTSQLQLTRLLKSRGYAATQPSICRDLRELGVVKLAGRYVATATTKTTETQAPDSARGDFVLSVEEVGLHLVVVKTSAGAASIVGAVLDGLDLSGVAGTVAGDDTLFVATKNHRAQEAISRAVRQKFPAKPHNGGR